MKKIIAWLPIIGMVGAIVSFDIWCYILGLKKHTFNLWAIINIAAVIYLFFI